MISYSKIAKEFLKKSFIFVLAFVLLFEIAPIKSVIINILQFAEKNNILLGLKLLQISEIFIFIKKYSLIYLIFCITCFPFVNCYLLIRNYFNSPNNYKLDSFEESLHKYINDKFNGKGYLVTGQWGSGKTYIVTEFFNKYFKFSTKPIYRISCFGLDSRKLILDEIKNQIEINDRSSFNWIQHIPAIGKPLFSILKDSYSLNSIPKGSVFIFDDFERITSLGIANNQKFKSYEKDKFILRSRSMREPQFEEFKDINKEFTKIEDAFSKYSKNNEIISITNNLQKYNIITGLINELIENYNIKVIIICNVDILGYDYLDKVFRGKLDCITYNKSIDEKSIESIFKSALKSQIYSNKTTEELVTGVTNTIVKDFKKVWFSSGNSNLRQAKAIFQAFLDTISVIGSNVNLNENYLLSLFYSIYVVMILRDENNLEELDQFLVGGNLAFFLNLYFKKDLYNSLKLSDYFTSLKWTGISISGFWLLNMARPDDINKLVNYYNDYEYNDLELALLQNNSYNWDDKKILVEHAMYVVKEQAYASPEKHDKQFDEISNKFRNNIGFILEQTKQGEEIIADKVLNLLCKMNTILGGNYYPKFLEDWYKSIYEYSKVESVIEEENIFILNQYNEFIKRTKGTA